MPYLNVHIGKPVSEEKKTELMLAIAGHMPLIPGKTIDNTMIEISAGRDIYMGGEKKPLIFVDMRILGTAPLECKDAFVKALAGEFEKILGIPGRNLYFNIIDMPAWGSGGGVKAAP